MTGIPGLIDGCLSAKWDQTGALCLSMAAGTTEEAVRIDCVLHGEHASAIWGLLTGQSLPTGSVPCGVGVCIEAAPAHRTKFTATAKG